jgi:hypothetical protein
LIYFLRIILISLVFLVLFLFYTHIFINMPILFLVVSLMRVCQCCLSFQRTNYLFNSLIALLRSFTVMVVFEEYLLIPIHFLDCFPCSFQNCFFLSFSFISPRIFLIIETNKIDYFLIVMDSSFSPMKFISCYALSSMFGCLSSWSLWRSSLTIFYDDDLVFLNCFSLSLTWMVFLSPSTLKD